MLWVPQKGVVRVVTNAGIVGAVSPWTALPENASANLYGTVTEIIPAASNVQDSWGIEVAIGGTGGSASAAQASVDILIGGATDDVLISSLLCGYAHLVDTARYFFPIHIPAGVRIAARLSSGDTGISPDPYIGIWLYGGATPPFQVGRKVTTYGTKIDNSRGKAVVPAASGGAASVTEMTASSSEAHFYLLPGFQPATDTTITPAGWLSVGIGVGAATEERVGSWWYAKDTVEHFAGPVPTMGAFVDVPAATRLSLLVSNSGANDAAYDGHIYAVS